jgi:hypothetical protein
MAKHRRYRMGQNIRAHVDTKLRCSDDNRKSLKIISRELVRTRCIDRVVECVGNRHVVLAICPTEGARRHFEEQVRKHAKVLELAKGV